MAHYLNHFASSVKKYWDSPMFTNFGANTLTYGDVACGIEKYHILFSECGIKKGDKIALCARNSAEWGMAFMAIVTYDAVIVPLLPDFLPKSVVELSCFSDSKMLIADSTCYNGFKDDAEAVAQIRKAYDALTDEQKALVKGYDDLVAAEAMLEALLGESENYPYTAGKIRAMLDQCEQDGYCGFWEE